jgi:hypothetical protein
MRFDVNDVNDDLTFAFHKINSWHSPVHPGHILSRFQQISSYPGEGPVPVPILIPVPFHIPLPCPPHNQTLVFKDKVQGQVQGMTYAR